MLEMQPLLILSTSHVSETTARMLDATPVTNWPAPGGHYNGYGWFLYAGHDEGPEDLRKLFDFARNNLCHYILLDRDASVVEELPVYDW